MYEGAAQTWKEWGRSLDLKDASSTAQLWGDLWLLLAVQGFPLPIVISFFLLFPPSFPYSLTPSPSIESEFIFAHNSLCFAVGNRTFL